MSAAISIGVLLAGCSADDKIHPPSGAAGTLIVHLHVNGGACFGDGRCGIEYPLPQTIAIVRDGGYRTASSVTDKHGDARFRLAPGKYTTESGYDCGTNLGGVSSGQRVTVKAGATAHAVWVCGLP